MNEHRVIRGLFMVAVAIGTACNALADTFTWQGRLSEQGEPANGVYDFQFTLWTDLTGGSTVGTTRFADDVLLVDGVATIHLTFDPGAFDGTDRWLEVRVKADADAAYQLLDPRQPVHPTPYALFAGAAGSAMNISDGGLPASYTSPISLTSQSNSFTGSSLHVEPLHTDSGNVGIGTTSPERLLHITDGDAGLAPLSDSLLVVERNTNTYMNMITPSGSASGLLFGNPTGGSAAGGILFNASGAPQGLQFRVNGNLTKMVLQSDGDLGVGTSVPGADLHVRGDSVLGEAIITPGTADSSAQLRLTENVSASLGGILRYDGAANQMQVLGLNFEGETGPHLAIGRDNGRVGIGTTSPASALDVNGKITVAATTRYLSLHNSAFVPSQDEADYFRTSTALYKNSGNSWYFYAPVNLPHGAVIKELTVAVRDNAPQNFNIWLLSTEFDAQDPVGQLTEMSTSGQDPAYTTWSTTTFEPGTTVVDNERYMYTLTFGYVMPAVPTSMLFLGARIRYEVTSPLP